MSWVLRSSLTHLRHRDLRRIQSGLEVEILQQKPNVLTDLNAVRPWNVTVIHYHHASLGRPGMSAIGDIDNCIQVAKLIVASYPAWK